MVDWLEVAKHGVLGGRLVEVPQLQKRIKTNKEREGDRSRNKPRQSTLRSGEGDVRFAHLNVQHLVIGAGGQQEASCRVGELTVVHLLFVLLLKHPQEHGSLHVPHLRDARVQVCLLL